MLPKKQRLTEIERAQKKAERATQRRREVEEERGRRASLREEAGSACRRIDESLRAVHGSLQRRAALSSHLKGLYEELDKLARRKKPLEATNLAVAQVNEIVREAKELVAGDPYLARLEEFDPGSAGPVYSDLLLVARTVQQSMLRFKKRLIDREKRLARLAREGRTIETAMALVGENGELPSKHDVEGALDEKAVDRWFFDDADGEQYFSMDRLESLGVREVLKLDD
jgi:hypothetical protein